jgi:peptide/nickel transport system substrate-binding protein
MVLSEQVGADRADSLTNCENCFDGSEYDAASARRDRPDPLKPGGRFGGAFFVAVRLSSLAVWYDRNHSIEEEDMRREAVQRVVGLWSMALGILYLSIAVSAVWADETPRYGGVLRVAIAAEPPSLDCHQEQTFAIMMTAAPVYNTLLQFSPTEYPKIIGDLAASWTVSEDGLTYTFTIHQGVKFHDGSDLTSADIKASYEKIIWPPEDVISVRKETFQAVDSISTPDPHTIVFSLKYPSASMLANLASPWNVIYPKKYLDQDPNYFKTHMLGSGPFKFKRYIRGSTFEVVRNPDYWVKGRPYLDGVKFFFIKDLSARAKSLRANQTDIEFRNMPPAEVEAMLKQKGDALKVQYPGWVTFWGVAPNTTRPPLNDERVRKALTLAIDRYDMAETLYPLTGLNGVGGLMRPGTPWALDAEELAELPGYSKDSAASRAQAKRLLAEAGYDENHPLKLVLKNRSVKLPYIDFGVYLISAWQKVGVQVKHQLEETAAWRTSQRQKSFDLMVAPGSDYADEPDIQLSRWITGGPQNYPGVAEPAYDKLYEQQSRELDPQKRIALVKEMQRLILNKAYFFQGLWSSRAVVHSAKVKNYVAHPSHYTNQRLQDVWLAK